MVSEFVLASVKKRFSICHLSFVICPGHGEEPGTTVAALALPMKGSAPAMTND